jgi:hypothetical protein
MLKICVLILLLAGLFVASGCKTHSGSREYIPGEGWKPND